ncbi:MAG: hypothetical protein HFE42_06675 [Clostridia bacterium]|jgi:hypothetical protein|nr:hypothetical protein [Clostridia bacterium]
MEFDIIELTPEELSNFTSVQMQLLRSAQKNKNTLRENMDRDLRLFKSLLLTDDVFNSSLYAQKRAELEREFDFKTESIAEQLRYNLSLSEPYDPDDNDDEAGYIVDYTLSYNERYRIVRDYYLSITDPAERMALYSADDTARKYLGSYYASLYNVLYSYSK